MARWVRSRVFVPVLAAAVLATGGVALARARAASTPNLPPVAPARLVASVARALAARPSVSGMLDSHVAIGLPALSDSGAAAAGLAGPAETLSYVNGDHRIRFWSSKDGVKIAELLPTEEISYTLGRSGAWLWSSERFAAVHIPLPPGANPVAQDKGKPLDLLNLDQVAARAIQAITPTTAVSVQTPVRVAGRDAYALVLTPKATDTLVGRIEVDVDAKHRVPLRVAVFARGASAPALSLGYRTVSFGPVDPSTFDFHPPTGAKVTTPLPGAARPDGQAGPLDPSSTRVIGQGWSAVVAVKMWDVVRIGRQANGTGIDIRQFLPFSGPLFSARLEPRAGYSWLLFGAVPQSRLLAVAGQLP